MCRTPDVSTSTGLVHGNRTAEPASPVEAAEQLEQLLADRPLPSPGFIPVAHPDYSANITQRWTTWQAPSYIGAIKPATEEDVAKIVRLCVRNGIPFLATGGGHGAGTGYGSVKDALNIDLGNFRSVQLDAPNNRLTVGGATLAGQIYEPLFAAGKELPTGRSPCVGLVGLTLGGGIGTLQGRHGLVMDALESVRMVTAEGTVVEASEKVNADLFWALRGAGANFGIVTSATYRVFEASHGGRFVNADFEYAGARSRGLWEILKALDDDMPGELSVVIGVGYNRVEQQPVLIANAVYSGPMEDAQRYLKAFTALGPTRSSVTMATWPELSSVAQFGTEWHACQRNQFVNVATVGLGRIHVPTLEAVFAKFIAFYEAHPAYDGRFGFQKYSNDVVAAVPASKTVYPGREIKTHVLFRNMHRDSALDRDVDDLMRTLRHLFSSTSGLGGFRAYINYAHGDESPEVLYGAENLPRLVSLKRKWDPSGAFGKGYPVPLS